MANIIKIADFSDEALDFYAREKEAQLKHRPAHGRGMFIAERDALCDVPQGTSVD